MAKIPKKDLNLYPLVVAPKKKTVKKGALFAVAGAAAVVLLVGGYVGARVYVHTHENLVAEMQEKANDAELMEKINNANAVAADINTLRTAGNAYSEIRVKIDGSQEYCDNFSDDLVEKLVSCEDTVSPSKGATKVAKITGLSYDGSVVSTFVANLTRLGLFSTVTYDGYTFSEGTYTYTISAVFKSAETTVTDADGNPVETTTEVAQ